MEHMFGAKNKLVFINGSTHIPNQFDLNRGARMCVIKTSEELVCYSDSLYGINLIKGLSMKYHVYAILIQDIKDLIE